MDGFNTFFFWASPSRGYIVEVLIFKMHRRTGSHHGCAQPVVEDLDVDENGVTVRAGTWPSQECVNTG